MNTYPPLKGTTMSAENAYLASAVAYIAATVGLSALASKLVHMGCTAAFASYTDRKFELDNLGNFHYKKN